VEKVSDLTWEIVTTADFNGDGRPDILWVGPSWPTSTGGRCRGSNKINKEFTVFFETFVIRFLNSGMSRLVIA
jgi:hypothetical protein